MNKDVKRLSLRIKTPIWLSAVTWLLIRLLGLRAALGWEASEQDVDAFGRWYADHLKIEACEA